MAFNDPIAEFLTRIRNSLGARHLYVDIPLSKMKVMMAKILRDKGFIENFLVSDKKNKIRIFLKYTAARKPMIQGLKRVSSPGCRRYVGLRKVPKIRSGLGIAIVSTSKGIMDDESARNLRIGGELLCLVW